jgi:integrase
MGRIAKPLAAIEVGRIKGAGYHAVGTVPGLHLQVSPNGARSWVIRIMVGSKRREIGLGPYPAITLAMAHQKARDTRELAEQGVDPVDQKNAILSALKAEQAKAITFGQAAQAYIKAVEAEWRNPKHAKQWAATLETYAFPVMGGLLVRDIGLTHVLKVLEPIWQTKTETASRLRGRIESVLAWATTRGYRSGENPARWRGHLDTLLAAPNKIKGEEHYPAVSIVDAGAFLRDLRARVGMGARALEFTMLTAARSGEVRGAVWSEIDLDAGIWTIPAGRMKAGREHSEPLSPAAVHLLKEQPRFDGEDIVFPSPRGGTMSDMTLSKLMKSMGYKDRDGRLCVPHGLRSTFRDWAAERTNYPREVVEAALAHTNADKTEAAYLRSNLLVKRSGLMAEWSKFLARVEVKSGQVVAIGRAA